MKLRTDQRNYVIAALCAILIVMGVGYAAFSSLLTINGTANISNSWCVGFDQTKTNTYQITKGVSTGTEPTGEMTYSGTACETNYVPNARLASVFHQPGDQIVYTLTIKNSSSVGAAIKSIKVDNEDVTSNKTVTKDNITYIVEMPETTTLAAGASTTMKVTAKFQNETDVTGPYSGETKTIEVGINVEEDDGNGGFTPTPVSTTYTGPIYRWSTTSAQNGNSIANLTEETDYVKNATLLNKMFYLKHDVVDDIITASYVCFVTDEEHCMQGGGTYDSVNNSWSSSYYAANVGVLQSQESWFDSDYEGEGGCNLSPSGALSYCYGGGFGGVSTNSDGEVYAGDNISSCEVYNDGTSSCHV